MKATEEIIVPLVEKIPAFPQSVNKVLALTSDINCSPKELVEVVSLDPVLTLKILKLVNSAYFGLANKVTSIRHALVYLGLNTLKNITLSLAMIGALPKKNKAGFDSNALWIHSLAVGSAAKLLARARGAAKDETEDYFVAGLLHDVGKLVFARYMPDEFKAALDKAKAEDISLHDAEKQVISATHAEVGAMLAKKWELPDNLAACLGRHHVPDKGGPLPMLDVVFAANQAAKAMQFGYGGDAKPCVFPEGVASRLGFDLEETNASLPDLQEELDKAAIMIRV